MLTHPSGGDDMTDNVRAGAGASATSSGRSAGVADQDAPEHFDAMDTAESYDQNLHDDGDAMSELSEDDAAEDSNDDEDDDTEGSRPGPSIAARDDSVQGFFDHKDSIYAVAIHPTVTDIAASGGGDEKAYLWRISTGERLATLDGHSDSVTGVSFSADGSLLATSGMDGLICVWKVSGGEGAGATVSAELAVELEPGSEVMWATWHPKGNVLVAGTQDGLVWMWNLPKGDVMHTLSGHTGACTYGVWASDGKSLVTCAEDATLIKWDPRSGSPVARIDCAADERLAPGPDGQGAWNVVAVDPTATVVAAGSSEGLVKVINLAGASSSGTTNNNTLIASLEAQQESIEAIAYSSSATATGGALLACASVEGSVAIYEAGSLRLRTTLKHDDAVVALHFEPNTPYLFTASTDRSCRKWDIRTGQQIKQWTGHQDSILCMAVAKGGSKVVTAGDDFAALVFE
ncbi:hypothetical protein PYCC9005_002682 [Savitreella phatthalungensis]